MSTDKCVGYMWFIGYGGISSCTIDSTVHLDRLFCCPEYMLFDLLICRTKYVYYWTFSANGQWVYFVQPCKDQYLANFLNVDTEKQSLKHSHKKNSGPIQQHWKCS